MRFSTVVFVSFSAPTLALFGGCSGTVASDGTAQDGGNQGDGGAGGNQDGGGSNDAGKACTTASDCGPNPGASCARVCKDGSNPCSYTCSSINTCVAIGCPEDNAPSGCSPACTSGDICVSKQFNGGAALLVDDAGACPPGHHAQGGICAADPVYDCESRPASCGVPFDCSCTSSICTDSYQCVGTTPNEIDCALDAP